MKRLLSALSLCLLLVTVTQVSSYYDKGVLGISTQTSDAVFPPITAGPGHLLPDSPFYFIDKLYQQFRLVLVFSPENRAWLHTQIAQERLAELRVEASRNNQGGVVAALIEVEQESLAAAHDIRDAASQGKDVTQLARTIHQSLTDYRSQLEIVEAQVPNTAFAEKLAATSGVLREARIISEDALPQNDIEHEIAANVDQEVQEAVLGIASSTKRLESKLNAYEKYASNSGSYNPTQIRDREIASLRKQIAELQMQLDRLLSMQKQASKSAKPNLTPRPTKSEEVREKMLSGTPTPSQKSITNQ